MKPPLCDLDGLRSGATSHRVGPAGPEPVRIELAPNIDLRLEDEYAGNDVANSRVIRMVVDGVHR
jgi:hypothetical protein